MRCVRSRSTPRTLINTDSTAQAEAVIKRLTVIDAKSPLSLYFQGMLAQRKKDVATAADDYCAEARLPCRPKRARTAI